MGAYEEEEEEEEEGEFSLLAIRYEVIEYILRRYGCMHAKEIARILGCGIRDVNRTLRALERSGRVRRAKLGGTQVWSSVEELQPAPMYY